MKTNGGTCVESVDMKNLDMRSTATFTQEQTGASALN